MARKTYTLLLNYGDIPPNVNSDLTADALAREILSVMADNNSCQSAIILDHEIDRSFRLDWGEIDDTED